MCDVWFNEQGHPSSDSAYVVCVCNVWVYIYVCHGCVYVGVCKEYNVWVKLGVFLSECVFFIFPTINVLEYYFQNVRGMLLNGDFIRGALR